jgi:hypothetical protein
MKACHPPQARRERHRLSVLELSDAMTSLLDIAERFGPPFGEVEAAAETPFDRSLLVGT